MITLGEADRDLIVRLLDSHYATITIGLDKAESMAARTGQMIPAVHAKRLRAGNVEALSQMIRNGNVIIT